MSVDIGLLIANVTIIAGSILSHGAIWYKIGKIENKIETYINGGK